MSPEDSASTFESLLARIAAELLSVPIESFDAAISSALTRLVAFLGVERAQLALIDASDGRLRTTHAVAAPGATPIPIGTSETGIPWIVARIREERTPVVLSSERDLPPDAGEDAQTMRRLAVRSFAMFPMAAGDQFIGLFSFGSTQAERQWPGPLVDRLRLIGEILAGGFLRREHERKLRAALTELQALRDHLQAETDYLREDALGAESFGDIVGASPALRVALVRAEHVALTDSTVLLLGESGTGKELVAEAIHARSSRRGRTLVKVNCAALPASLIESELFGHEKGAFTGAISRKTGRFEVADGSTLFLDEIGELPLALQAKLLRVLERGEFERLGSVTTLKVDVRVIGASNRDLGAAAREGDFRPDLYYRLNVFPIELPPLRARREDIRLLVWHFLGGLGRALGKKIERVPANAMEQLIAYDWPGNVRELRNVLERSVILSPGPTLLLAELGDTHASRAAASTEPDGVRTLGEVEREHILHALESCEGRVRGAGNAAERLGINASTLYSRMKKLGIRRPASRGRRGAGKT